MIIAAFIFVISLAALVQFAVLTWRAGVLRVAAQPLLPGVHLAAEMPHNPLITNNFETLSMYHDICPDLRGGSAPTLRSVQLYYRAIRLLSALGSHILPSKLSSSPAWVEREMALCTRYAAVVLSHRLAHNKALLAGIRSL
jgi:hypothetical protein